MGLLTIGLNWNTAMNAITVAECFILNG